MNNIVKVISLMLGLGVLLNLLAISSGNAQVQNAPLKETKEFRNLVQRLNDFKQASVKVDPRKSAEASYMIGRAYLDIRNVLKAREWFFRAARIRKSLHDFYELGRIYERLVECELRLEDDGKIDNVIRFAHLSRYNFVKSDSARGRMVGLRQAAIAHQYGWEAIQRNEKVSEFIPSLDSAIYFFERSLKIAIQLNLPVDIALCYQNLGGAWECKKELLKGIAFKKKAIAIFVQERKFWSAGDNSIHIGKEYLVLGRLEDGKFWLDKAKHIGSTAQLNSPEYNGRLAEGYASYFERSGDLPKAIDFLKQVTKYELLAEKVYHETAFEGIRLSNEIEKHQIQLQSQKKELISHQQKARLRFWLIILTSTLLVVAAFAGLFYYGLFKKYRIISKVNAKLVQEQSHRFNNNLQKISGFLHLQQIEVSDPTAVIALEQSQLRVEAVALVHKLLYSGEELVEVAVTTYLPDLIEAVLQSYSIEQVIIDYELDDVMIHVDQAITIGLIVTELTTNACKYALGNHEDPRLRVTYKKRDKTVTFSFRDNGSGFKKSDKSSFGLRLIELLVLNLKGTGVFTSDRGTCFELSFKTDVS